MKKKNKRSISKLKKNTIKYNKLRKQGKISKKSKKSKANEKAEKKQTYFARLQRTEEERKKQTERENEITGDEMLEMINTDDLHTLSYYKSDKNQSVEEIEKGSRRFQDDEVHLGDGKMVKSLLPVLTEEGGWTDTRAVVSTEKPENLLTHYKRTLKKKKRKKGKSEEQSLKEAKEEKNDDEEEDSGISEDENIDKGDSKSPKTVVQVMVQRERTLNEMKLRMASLATQVIEDPTKVYRLRSLLDMLDENKFKDGVNIIGRRYLLLTILQVFHDLIPGYRIQENVFERKLKKATLAMAKQEVIFLQYYRNYLQTLENILEDLKKSPNDVANNALSETALYCMGDMLVLHPRFNYANNIIHAIVPYLNHNKVKLRSLAFDPLFQTIKSDKSCSLTIEIVKTVYQLIRRLKFKIKEEPLKVFFALRVNEMKNPDLILEEKKTSSKELSLKDKMIRKLASKAANKPSRKKQKEVKKMARLREEMAEINARNLITAQNSKHSEIIQLVFGVYFHILKKKPQSKLISVVLEGLSKFAHLINIDFFSDLLSVLHGFLEENKLESREALFCIQTVFTILSGQGEALNVDPQRFYNRFYAILGDLPLNEKEENIGSILKVIEQMLIMRKKKVSTAKVLSFAKRLATVCLTLSHRSAIPTLVILKRLFTVFTTTEALLDPDPDGSSGMYSSEISDPEHANPAATALWEMNLCQHHFHPSARILAKNILSGVMAREVPAVFSLTQKSVDQLLNDFDTSRMKFNPAVPLPDIHLKRIKQSSRKIVDQDGTLDLNNLKLQSLCDQYLNDDLSHTGQEIERPMKRQKLLSPPTFHDDCVKSINDDLSPSLTLNVLPDFSSYYTSQ